MDGPITEDRLRAILAEDRAALVAQLRALAEDFTSAASAVRSRPTETFISAADLAEQVGRSAPWVREHHAEFGGVRDGDGPKARYRFPADAAESWRASRAGADAPPRVEPLRLTRHRRSPAPST